MVGETPPMVADLERKKKKPVAFWFSYNPWGSMWCVCSWTKDLATGGPRESQGELCVYMCICISLKAKVTWGRGLLGIREPGQPQPAEREAVCTCTWSRAVVLGA